eukprot:1540276-Amphidinium_carterae.1
MADVGIAVTSATGTQPHDCCCIAEATIRKVGRCFADQNLQGQHTKTTTESESLNLLNAFVFTDPWGRCLWHLTPSNQGMRRTAAAPNRRLACPSSFGESWVWGWPVS